MGGKKIEERFSSAGWVFWCVAFFVFIGPSIYIARKITYEDTPWVGIVGTGAVIGATAAALVTWAVNTALQYNAKRRRLSDKKRTGEKKKVKKS